MNSASHRASGMLRVQSSCMHTMAVGHVDRQVSMISRWMVRRGIIQRYDLKRRKDGVGKTHSSGTTLDRRIVISRATSSETEKVQLSSMHNLLFDGIEKLYGREALLILERSSVAVIGLGGVGSWCAEVCMST